MELPMHSGHSSLLLGLSSVLGLIGGAYLLQVGAQHVWSKIVDKKQQKSKQVEAAESLHSCNVCCAELDLSSGKNYITCGTCGKFVCRNIKCAAWRPQPALWECELCQSSKQSLAHTSSWVAEQMSFNQHKFVYPLRARSEVYIPIIGDSSMNFESVSQVGAQSMSVDERSRIREYVEEIVADILGSNLDHIKVGQLSKSENYLQLFDKYHAKLSNQLINLENALSARAFKEDLPAIVNANNNNNNINNNNNNSSSTELAETRLRSLIESIIAETLRCSSALSASAAVSEISLDTRAQGEVTLAKRRHRTEHYFEPQIYQELLATAVLNKLADKEGNSRLIAESTPDLSAHNIDENYNAEALSTTSGSSIEPRSDCSLTDHELQLNSKQDALHENLQPDLERESVLSDYIAAHMVPLPDFSASVTESEDEIMSMTSSMMGEGTWEDNWLFKKKRSSATPSSIGMLVPAPKEHVRAQIGDRTADEVSDLSEMGSDAEESSLDMLRCNELNDRLLSKHLIGGQNTKLVLDELLDNSSLNSNTLPGEGEPAYAETSNTLVTQPTAALTIETAAGTDFGAPPPPMIFQDENEENVEPVQNLIADQLSAAHRQSTESTPSTSEEFFGNGEASAAQEFISYSSMQMAERLSSSTNCEITNTKTNSLNTDTNKARTLRPNGKLTNGSLKWCNKSLNDLENGHNLEVVDVDVNVDVDDAEDDVVLLRRFVPGSIAEREVKKWYNAVEMPNNPYAPEALKQRISGTQERLMDVPNISPSAEQKTLELLTNAGKDEPVSRVDDCKRYSRDYYINSTAASKSSPSNSSRDRHSDSPQADQTDEDIVINEANAPANVFKAVPAQVLDESHSSMDTQSTPSIQSQATTSDDSDTVRVYDCKNQQTKIIRPGPELEPEAETELSSGSTPSMESAQSEPSPSICLDNSRKRERPVVLQFGPADAVPTVSSSPTMTPTRGSTPPAFRFLQPKRRLIEPSQVLSIDEDEVPQEPSTPTEKQPAIEKEVAHAMPSVKALAKAFMLTNKHMQAERRLRAKHVTLMAPDEAPRTPSPTQSRRQMLQHAVSMAEVADESTIASDLSSLETDPSSNSASSSIPIASPASPVPVRRGFLRSNIAFFENLKFK
ncbi:uncharacterized protein LOC108596318 isoform X3 [Drosophila busckii]|uniref:uncharacterized protein LOC108596318 isoform X3 n=1 Tax=Drosophila busckii TaxID=30019 RepID=UPI001433256A|nr:uncharacterized protein LOC108596318 isoform X3 [Drosophila busckii]